MNAIHTGGSACEQVRGYLDSYLSNELLVETNHEVLQHLEGCAHCTADLQARAHLRSRLQNSVRGMRPPDGLEAKVQRTLRTRHSQPRAGLAMLAAAAVVLVCVVLFNMMRAGGPEEAILRKASGHLAAVLNVGLRDHLHCAVFRKYPRQPDSGAQMAAELGPAFADLAPLVKAKLPAGFVVLEGHQCRAGNRQYVHFIVEDGGKVMSLVLTRRQAGESLHGGLFQQGVDRYQVVGFESHDYLAYIVSDLDAQQNLQVAASLAPVVREYLTSHAG